MSVPEPPSFDEIFNHQQNQRQNSAGSSSSTSYLNGGLTGDILVHEEPKAFSRKGSQSSLVGAPVGGRTQALRGDSAPTRKESVPFDPETSSTFIATAPKHPHPTSPLPHQTIGDIMFAPSPQYNYEPQQQQQQHQQYQVHQNHQQQQYGHQWNMPGPSSQPYMPMTNPADMYVNQQNPYVSAAPQSNGANDAYLYNNQPSYQANTFDQQGDYSQQQNGEHWIDPNAAGWAPDFLNSDSQDQTGTGQDFSWTGDGGDGMGMEGMLGGGDQFSELEKIISHSQAGSNQPSRQSTPLPGDMHPSPGYIQQTAYDESALTSRSTSPFHQAPVMGHVVSPPPSATLQRNSPSPHPSSPHFNKPQSPPALIIPGGHSPSALPPIVTSTTQNNDHGGQQGQHIGSGLGGNAGGLFPPANPALEGLTGMAGISPIAPNADGPQIYVQPSTPISGLKDGRGVFDFKRVLAQNQAQQQGQQQGTGFAVPGSGQHTLSRHSSVEGLHQSRQASPQPQAQDLAQQQQHWVPAPDIPWATLKPNPNMRPRAKSDSQMVMTGAPMFDRSAFINPATAGLDGSSEQWKNAIDQWRTTMAGQQMPGQAPTVDPRSLPGQDTAEAMAQLTLSQQFSALQAQRDRLPPLNTSTLTHPTGQFSPTSMAFYQQLGVSPSTATQLDGTSSAPFYQSSFQDVGLGQWPQTAGVPGNFLAPDQGGLGPRRRSFAEGTGHPAAGAGTPGYGVEFTQPSPFGTLNPGRVRGLSPGNGHRRAAKSEDLGRPGSAHGWNAGGATADFLSSITANDGSLVPPARGRSSSHSRHSSASSVRSASPALSISSQGSSFSHHSPSRMDMPEGIDVNQGYAQLDSPVTGRRRIVKSKVTSMATEVASTSRRTNDGVFRCPIPGCGSTFTRHFNLKGHLRSHNDERPYKCLYDGCPKAVVGFARQHDCKRHMLLHEGLRPFECEGCGKKFARLDALTRHHKSEQGQECAISHPLPTNPDGSPMSESQYKAYRAAEKNASGARLKREPSFHGYLSSDDRSGAEEDMGGGSGMEDYDRA